MKAISKIVSCGTPLNFTCFYLFIIRAILIFIEKEIRMKWKYVILVFFLANSLQPKFDAESYSKSNVGQFKHAIKELHKLNLSGSEKLLDIGSGDGRTSSYIAKEYLPSGCLIGIDNNSEMIVFAKSNNTFSNVSYLQADIREYKDQEQYDAIVSFWTLHWIVEYAQALVNIAESLKSGGKALICHIVGTDPLQPIVDKLLEEAKWKAYKTNVRLLNAPSLVKVAEAIVYSGLSIESLEVKKNGEWMQVETVKQNLLSLSLFDFIPIDLRADFCEDVLQNFIKEYPLNEKKEMFNWLPIVVMVLKK